MGKKELERTIDVLARRKKNNPVFVGEPGVGKTAISEFLAVKIHEGEVPNFLKPKRILSLELAGLVAGTKYRGDFEERIQNVCKEAAANPDVILMIDEIHSLVGAGGAEGSLGAGDMMKPMLANGQLQVMGATTLDEYRTHIEKDKALERRFNTVDVAEPSPEVALDILKGLKHKYEEFHDLKYTDEAIEACVKFADQYITDRYLPDKAIDLLDETGARKKVRASSNEGMDSQEKELETIKKDKQ